MKEKNRLINRREEERMNVIVLFECMEIDKVEYGKQTESEIDHNSKTQ